MPTSSVGNQRDIALLQEELRCLRERLSTMLSTAGGYVDQITSPGSSIFPDDYRENCECVDVITNESDPLDFCQTNGGGEGENPIGDLVGPVHIGGVFEFDAIQGVFYLPPASSTWESRNTGLTNVTLEHGCIDVWWYRKQTPSQDNVILYRVGTGKVLVSKNAGKIGWQSRTPTPPTGFTSGQIKYTQILSDPFQQNVFYLLATNGGKTWIVKTTDNFQTTAWLDLTNYNSVSVRTPIWMGLKGNGGATLWVTTWGDGQIRALKLNNGSPITISAEYNLGTATKWQVDNYYEVLSPVGALDSGSMWFYGRASNPQSLGLSHIIRTDNDGTSFVAEEQGWGDDWCGSLKFGLGGIRYAVRNLRGIPSSDPSLVGSAQAATGAGPNPSCSCGFAGVTFFDSYGGSTKVFRSTVSLDPPNIGGRTEIYDTGSLSTLGYHRYNPDLNAFLAAGLGTMFVSPPASGSFVIPEIDSTSAYVAGRPTDWLSSTDVIHGNRIGASPPLYSWLRNAGTTGDWGNWNLGDTSPAKHLSACKLGTDTALMVGEDNNGKIYARIFQLDIPNTELDSVASATSTFDIDTTKTDWLYRVSASTFIYIYNDGSVWKLVDISTAGLTITFGTPVTILSGVGTPYDVYVIDETRLAVVVDDGTTVKYVTLATDGTNSTPLNITSDKGSTDALAVGYSGGYAMVSYLKDSDDSLYVATVLI